MEPEQRSLLLAQALQKVPELNRAFSTAESEGTRLAIIGNTSRELNDYLEREIQQHGLRAVRKRLESKEPIALMDWHRVDSPLEFLVLSEHGEDTTSVRQKIEDNYAPSYLYSHVEIQDSTELISKTDSLIPVLTVPITRQGVEHIPQLLVLHQDRPTHLTRWGLEQYQSGTIEIPSSPPTSPEEALERALSLIRQDSESPTLRLSPETHESLKSAFSQFTQSKRLLRALERADRSLGTKPRPNASSEQRALFELMRIQLHSTDTENTSRLLDEFGIRQSLETSEIGFRRLYDPLPKGIEPPDESSIRPEKTPPLWHGSHLAALQNFTLGAHYRFSSGKVLPGKFTMGTDFVHSGALIPQEAGVMLTRWSSLEYGDFQWPMSLGPNALPQLDYVPRTDRYFIARSTRAFPTHPDGSIALEPLTRSELIRSHTEEFERAHSTNNKETALRFAHALAKVLSPDDNPEELTLFWRLAQYAHEIAPKRHTNSIIETYLQRGDKLVALLRGESALSPHVHPPLRTDEGTPAKATPPIINLFQYEGRMRDGVQNAPGAADALIEQYTNRPETRGLGLLYSAPIRPSAFALLLKILKTSRNENELTQVMSVLEQDNLEPADRMTLVDTAFDLAHDRRTQPIHSELQSYFSKHLKSKHAGQYTATLLKRLRKAIHKKNWEEVEHYTAALAKTPSLSHSDREQVIALTTTAVDRITVKATVSYLSTDPGTQSITRLATSLTRLVSSNPSAFDSVAKALIHIYDSKKLGDIRDIVLNSIARLNRPTTLFDEVLLRSGTSPSFAHAVRAVRTQNPQLIEELSIHLTQGHDREQRRRLRYSSSYDFGYRASVAGALSLLADDHPDPDSIKKTLTQGFESGGNWGTLQSGKDNYTQAVRDAIFRIDRVAKARRLLKWTDQNELPEEAVRIARDLVAHQFIGLGGRYVIGERVQVELHAPWSVALKALHERHPDKCSELLGGFGTSRIEDLEAESRFRALADTILGN